MQYIYGHTSPETAKIVEDYPWGYSLRTTVRYWVESKAGHGQRFCKQTMNPKTGKWCAPKHSTYSSVVVMSLTDEGHVKCHHLTRGEYRDDIINFKEKHNGNLDDFQEKQIQEELDISDRLSKIKWKCTLEKTVHII